MDIPRAYYYLVCLVTLIMLIVGAVQVVNRALDLAMPPEPYRPFPADVPAVRGEPADTQTTAEMERRADLEVERQRREQRRSATRGLVGSIALILVAGPIYWYHWRAVRRLGPAADPTAAPRP